MSQSGYNVSDLVREGQLRWLKPPEILFILKNYEDHMITHEPPQKPTSGSLLLYNKRVQRFFRKDGHSWRRKKDGRPGGEAHEKLKVGNVEMLNCYYAHGEQNPGFQRRSYWILEPGYDHIVLVHYRDINERRNSAGSISQISPVSLSTMSPIPSSYTTQQPGSSALIGESSEQYQILSSPGEISSDAVIKTDRTNYLDNVERTEEESSPSGLEISQALRIIEHQLSLNDDVKEIGPFYSENENSNLQSIIQDPSSSASAPGYIIQDHFQLEEEVDDWTDMLAGYSVDVVSQDRHVHNINENGNLLEPSMKRAVVGQESYSWLDFTGSSSKMSSVPVAKEVEDFKYPAYSSTMGTYVNNPDHYATLFDQEQIGFSFEDDVSLTISQNEKFTIREISPDWGYASETTKVVIIGSFLCDPSECTWTCMFGDVEVPVHIIQDGVISCHAPPHLPGKVALCVSSSNRESCSEVREFDYCVKPNVCSHCDHQDTKGSKNEDELLSLVRFAHLLLSTSPIQKEDSSESGTDLLGNLKTDEDSWSQVIAALLVGSSTSPVTKDWLLEELLKDKLQNWLSCRLGFSLSKKEQGVIHMIAGLGFEWALQPILKSGVSVNFRDINGWTALHWAARFGREKMVAALIASGALAGAVTDPTQGDPIGKTAAFIADTYGHKGLAGYLSERALTSHLSSLTLEESELSKGSADVEAEKTLNSVPMTNPTTNEDQLSLKDTLAAVRSAAQAAARIQCAFRAHSFRKRLQREAFLAGLDEYGLLSDDVQGLSAASKLAFRNSRDYNSAALSIQKKFRGYRGRKDFLAFRQKVVKIQAHVRGYQVRKEYRVCWAAGILEKVILRWRRRGVGLRGFRIENEAIDESEDEDILRVFRQQKVDAAIDEAVSRVLSMVESSDARQQYRRLLEKYRQAKAELQETKSETASSSAGFSNMENDDIYLL